jgi:hypothetical protein
MNNRPKKRKRHTAEERAGILAYVVAYNAKQGRGGQTAAAKKYKVSAITIGAWMKKSGASAPRSRKAGKPGAPVAVTGRMARRTSPMDSFSAKLRRLAEIHEEIVRHESSLNKLRAEYESIRNSL